MLADSGAVILLTQDRLVSALPTSDAQIVCLDRDWKTISSSSALPPTSGTSPDNAAYIIYTSGSTGWPKGAVGLHRSTMNCLAWMWKTYPFSINEVCCHKTSLSFVDSVWEIFGPLLQGVKTVLVPDGQEKDPHQLIDLLAAERVTRIVLVPSLLDAILRSEPEFIQRLKALVFWASSGEPLSSELAERFHHQMPWATLINLYGSSEVAADVMFHDTWRSRTFSRIAIGRPIANTLAYVLDRHLQPVPIGVSGGLYVGGVALARGYHAQPALTAERFIPNAFSASPGSRLYKTGDLARYRADGELEYLGRTDWQIKIRGFRIELNEIAVTLRQHPAVQQAIVVARTVEQPVHDKQLVAYVVLRPDQSITAEQLVNFLSERLPGYMLPAHVAFLAALPLLANGKVDREALLALPLQPRHRDATSIAPQTATEQTVAAIWQEALQVEQVDLHDNFFDVGGHSLLLVQIRSRLHDLFHIQIPITDLFRYPTIQTLAAYIGQRLATDQVHADGKAKNSGAATTYEPERRKSTGSIAIVGMAGRFPGAKNFDTFWQNLCEGREFDYFFL